MAPSVFSVPLTMDGALCGGIIVVCCGQARAPCCAAAATKPGGGGGNTEPTSLRTPRSSEAAFCRSRA